MNLPFRAFRSRVPDPGNLILKSGLVDGLDEWQIADRWDMMKAIDRYGKAYALDMVLLTLAAVSIGMMLGVLLSIMMGYEFDLYQAVFDLVFLSGLVYCISLGAVNHTVQLYRSALEEANEQ